MRDSALVLPPERPVGSQEGVRAMSPELRESRAALVLLAVAVLSVLVFGAVTLISQIG
ncbi:hypothetical protein [Methylobacterium nigriterrae]|uniref:hypothetical protein n=1 Tax=Methylobacterium nigriterrae TaxID=3127512 RepID=UPI003013DC05